MDLKLVLRKIYLDLITQELKMFNKLFFNNISYNSLLYLDLISCKKDCTSSFIADNLNIAKSAVTIKVKELEKLGLVYKTQSKEDKRIFYLNTTDKANEFYMNYNKALTNAINEINTQFSTDELNIFCNVAEVFSKHFIETNEESIQGEFNE